MQCISSAETALPSDKQGDRLAHIKEKTAPLPDAAARANEIPVV